VNLKGKWKSTYCESDELIQLSQIDASSRPEKRREAERKNNFVKYEVTSPSIKTAYPSTWLV